MFEPIPGMLSVAADALVAPTLLGLIGLGLIARKRLPQVVVGLCFVLSFSLAASLELIQRWPTGSGIVQDVARTCGMLSFVWSVCASAMMLQGQRQASDDGALAGFASLAYVVSLLLGVVVIVVQAIVLTIRMIYVAVDLVRGYPFGGAGEFGFGDAGLWSLAFVAGAGIISLMSTGDRRLGAALIWVFAIFGSWAVLLSPVLETTPTGGFVRTECTASWLLVLTLLVACGVSLSGWLDRQPLCDLINPPPADTGEHPDGAPGWPGLTPSVTLVSLVILLLSCYHLLVPVRFELLGPRVGGLLVALATVLAALACFVMYRRTAVTYAADAAMGLTTLTLCQLSTLFLPTGHRPAAERYPLLFTAVVVGFGASAVLWVVLVQAGARDAGRGRVESKAALLRPQCTRFAFLSGAMGLLASLLMAIWPRLPTISTMDDTLGRVSAGFAADLFLLLTALWSARRLRRLTFHLLAILTVLSCGGFILARILPLTARYG